MDKQLVLENIHQALEERFAKLAEASKKTRIEATDEETRSEGKYDTRGTEAGYLANGQALEAEKAAEALEAFQGMEVQTFMDGEPAALSALIEVEKPFGSAWYLIGPASGGLEVEEGESTVTVITAGTPLASQLMGLQTGDSGDFGKILQIL